VNDERLCSTDGNVAANNLKSNGHATVIWGKNFLATVLFLLVSTALRIKESHPARKFSIELRGTA
jgi:hypothetical protein